MANPVQQARKFDRQISGHTANPNATPGAGRGSRNGGGQAPAWAPANPRTQMPAQSPLTPRLNNLPTTNPNATQDSNRSGAFGKGAQNLQARRDLYAKMAADKGWQSNPAYRAQAQALGVTDKGWANAANRLAGFGSAPAPASPGIPPQPDTTKLRDNVTNNSPKPEQPPGQTPAKNSSVGVPYASAPPTTWGMTPGTPTIPENIAAPTPEVKPGQTPAGPVARTPASPPTLAPSPVPIAPQTPAPAPAAPAAPPPPDTRGRGNGAKRKKAAENPPYQSPGQGIATSANQIAGAFQKTSTSARPWWQRFTYQAPPSAYKARS